MFEEGRYTTVFGILKIENSLKIAKLKIENYQHPLLLYSGL